MLKFILLAPVIVCGVAWMQPAPEPKQTRHAAEVLGVCEQSEADRANQPIAFKAPCSEAIRLLHGSCKPYARGLLAGDPVAMSYFNKCLDTMPAT